MDGRSLSHETREEIRIRAVKRVLAGESPEDVIRTLGFHRSCIYDWIARYREGGLDALRSRPIPGRVPKLDGSQLRKLYNLVTLKDPQQLKFEFALWTRSMIRELIRREFGVALSDTSVGRLLRSLGLSPQRPLRRAYQQDAAAVEAWKSSEFPAIRAAAKKAKASIFFGDEAGIRSDYHSGTTWAPVGKTPKIVATGSRFGLNMISAISLRGELRFMTVPGRLTAPKFIDFLSRLVKDADRPVFLVVDRHPVHTSAAVRRFVEASEGRLRLFFLPAYSPELNPDEMVWKNVKHDGVGKRIFGGPDQLKSVVLGRLRSLQKLPSKIQAFFRHPETLYILASSVG